MPTPPISLASSGCASLAGGIIIMAVTVPMSVAFGLPFGVIPGLVAVGGLLLATYRCRRDFLPDEGELVSEHRLLFFSWSGRRRIGRLVRMRIGPPTVVGSGKNRRTVYHLDAEGELSEFRIDSPQDPLRARREAERWARHCAVAISDRSSRSESVRQAGELDRTAAERVQPADLAAPRPASMRCTVLEERDAVVVVQPFNIGRAVGIGFAMLFATGIAAVVLFSSLPTAVAAAAMAALVVGDVVAGVVLWRAGAFAQRLRIEPGRQVAVGGSVIAADALEEVIVGRGPARLRLVSDQRLLDFGQGLDEAELAYIRALVLGALRTRR
ncbi:MAG: hypothetical protein J0M02_05745 [Planctomycetes bacterium]|nr:hypothetical protein [Planctomycetota bacterium]